MKSFLSHEMNDWIRKIQIYSLHPWFFNILSLVIIVLLSFFVYQTLSSGINEGLKKGEDIAFGQYEERERELAKDGVLQLINSIEWGTSVTTSEEGYKNDILGMIRNGALGKESKRGFFIFDENDICLVSYDYPELEGFSLYDLPVDIASRIPLINFFDYLRSEEGAEGAFLQYTAGDLDYEKTAYAAYYPRWGWIIGAGYYREDGEMLLTIPNRHWVDLGQELLHDVMLRVILFSLLIYSTIHLILFLLKKSFRNLMKIYSDFEIFRDALDENLCVMVTNSEGIVTRVNNRYCKLARSRKKEILGKRFNLHFHPEEKDTLGISMRNSFSKSRIWTGIIKGLNSRKEEFWLQAQIKSLYEKGTLKGYLAVGLDITELKTVKDSLKRSGFFDILTGSGNWEKLLHDYDESDSAYVAYYNIDGFSSVYKFYGKDLADRILTHVAKKFQEFLTGKELLYRISNDTFVILHPEKDSNDFIPTSRMRLRAINEEILEIMDFKYHISMRAGIAVSSSTENLALADIALEQAKDNIEGITILDDCNISGSQDKKDEIQRFHMIKEAILGSGLFLMYQPIFNLATQAVDKYECLIRLRMATGEILLPDEFIELSKKGRVYKQITEFVILTACRQFRGRSEDFSINITLEDFSDSEIISFLIERANELGVNHRLILEIVETEELRDFDGISKIIGDLKKEGIRIAIDDFGSGFSNFKYLLQLNADYIKIDGSLIKNLISDRRNQTLVNSIINFAKCSDIKTIAEYVENKDLLDMLKVARIDYGQGYYIGEPEKDLPPEQDIAMPIA